MRVKGVRQRGVRRVGRTGLRFFAGVARRLLAPLSVVSTSISRLGRRMPTDSSIYSMVTSGAIQLVQLVRRVLRFEGIRGNGLQLGISRKGIDVFLGGSISTFTPLIGGRGLSVRFSLSRRCSKCFSISGLSGIICGLLSGTTGCAPRKKAVIISRTRSRRGEAFGLDIGGPNRLVPGRGLSRVFREFCRKRCHGFRAVKANVNLSLAGSLMLLRRKAVRMFDSGRRKGAFIIRVPVKHRTFTRSRMSRGARGISCTILSTSRVRGISRVSVLRRGPTTSAVLLIRSGRRLLTLVIHLLRNGCRVLGTTGKARTLRVLTGRRISLVISSIVVPRVSNVRLYHQIGARFRAYRVPLVLLATGADSRSRIRKCRSKTSNCVYGPLHLSILFTGVSGLLGQHGHVKISFHGRLIFRTGRLGCASVSRTFVQGTISYIGTRLDSYSFRRTRFVTRVNVTQAALTSGLGLLAKLAPSTFVDGIHLRTTYQLVSRGGGVHVTSLTCTMNFGSPGCFDSYFGGGFKLSPARCVVGCSN